jgi:hypothetical protein
LRFLSRHFGRDVLAVISANSTIPADALYDKVCVPEALAKFLEQTI